MILMMNLVEMTFENTSRAQGQRIAAPAKAMVREIKPDMSPRESDESWPLSTRGSRSTAARMRHVRFPRRLVCARGFG